MSYTPHRTIAGEKSEGIDLLPMSDFLSLKLKVHSNKDQDTSLWAATVKEQVHLGSIATVS